MGFPCFGGAAGTGMCAPFLLPPQLGMPPHIREYFEVYQTWLQRSDSKYPAQDGAWPLWNPACWCRRVGLLLSVKSPGHSFSLTSPFNLLYRES